jgi:hypothetical protein
VRERGERMKKMKKFAKRVCFTQLLYSSFVTKAKEREEKMFTFMFKRVLINTTKEWSQSRTYTEPLLHRRKRCCAAQRRVKMGHHWRNFPNGFAPRIRRPRRFSDLNVGLVARILPNFHEFI